MKHNISSYAELWSEFSKTVAPPGNQRVAEITFCSALAVIKEALAVAAEMHETDPDAYIAVLSNVHNILEQAHARLAEILTPPPGDLPS